MSSIINKLNEKPKLNQKWRKLRSWFNNLGGNFHTGCYVCLYEEIGESSMRSLMYLISFGCHRDSDFWTERRCWGKMSGRTYVHIVRLFWRRNLLICYIALYIRREAIWDFLVSNVNMLDWLFKMIQHFLDFKLSIWHNQPEFNYIKGIKLLIITLASKCC